MKKQPENIVILHNCTKSYDQMMHGSWDMVRDRCNFYFLFWATFCPSPTPPNSSENQNFEKMEKHQEISSFYISVPNIMTR